MTATAGFSGPEQEGIDYLRSEIEWHRKAGRYLFAIAASALTTATVLTRESLSDDLISRAESVPIVFSIIAALSAGFGFYAYYRRIATLKSITQAIIRLRIVDEGFREYWKQAFIPWYRKPEWRVKNP